MGLDAEAMGELIGALISSGADDESAGEDYGIGELIGELIGGEDYGISGDDFTVGADELATILATAGAAPPARGKGAAVLGKIVKQQQAKAALQKIVRGRAIAGFAPKTFDFRPPKYDKSRIIPMGFDSGIVVPPGGTATITQRPQVPFRPQRLVVPSDFAGVFLIQDLKVGNKSQLAANSALPARMFQEDATDSLLLLDTATPALDVVLIVTNIGGANQRFTAGIKGPAVE